MRCGALNCIQEAERLVSWTLCLITDNEAVAAAPGAVKLEADS